MKTFSTLGCLAAILIGLAAMSVDTWSNLEFQAGGDLTVSRLLQPDFWTSLKAAVVVVAIGTAAALTLAGLSWRAGRAALAAGLFVAFVFGALYSLNATLSRVADAKDGGVHKAQSHNVAIVEAKAAVSRWETALAKAGTGIKAECKGRDPVTLPREGWPLCIGHHEAALVAQERLDAARAQRAALGAPVVEDSGAERVSALVGGAVSPKQVTLYQPVLLPVALFLFGNLMVAFGFGAMAPARSAIVEVATAERPMKDVTPSGAVDSEPVLAALRQIGRPVNNRQLADAMGWTESTTHRRVKLLAAQGFIRKEGAGNQVAIEIAE